jgi:hypothetical protein
MRLLIVLILALLTVGCNPCQRLARKCPPQVVTEIRDSIIFKDTIIFRDRIIYDSIPGDTIEVEKEIPVEKELNVSPIRLENKYAKAAAWVETSKLKLTLEQKEQVIAHILDSAEREITHWKEAYYNKEVTETITVRERFTPKIMKFALFYALCLTILLLLYIVVRKTIKWP